MMNLLNRPARRSVACDVEEELRFHVEMLERKFAQHGMSSADAKAAALRRFGNPDKVRNQCVEIRRRSSSMRRLLKMLSILIALAGLPIQVLSVDYKVARIGGVLIMIGILGRLLLHVRGLSPSTFPTAKDGVAQK